jgi:hypothetical protein
VSSGLLSTAISAFQRFCSMEFVNFCLRYVFELFVVVMKGHAANNIVRKKLATGVRKGSRKGVKDCGHGWKNTHSAVCFYCGKNSLLISKND